MINLNRQWQTHNYSVTPDTSFEACCVVCNGYVFWGTGTNATSTVGTWYSAQLLSGNSFGQWQAISSMPQAVRWPALLGVTNDNYLIILGGQSASGFANNVPNLQTVKLNSNGTMGSWNNQPSFNPQLSGTLFDPILPLCQGGGLIASNGLLYSITASDKSGLCKVIQFSASYYGNGNGNVGIFSPIGWTPCLNGTSPIPSDNGDSIGQGSVAECNGYLVSISGFSNDNGILVPNIYTAKINFDGSLGIWNLVGSINAPRNFFYAAAYGNQIILTGGLNGSVIYGSTEVITVNNDGSVNVQLHPSNMQTPVFGISTQGFIYKDTIYIMGGEYNTVGSLKTAAIQFLQLT